MLYEQHHRSELNNSGKARYDAILVGMKKGLSRIVVPFPMSTSGAVVEAVLWDHPEVFYYTDRYAISGDNRNTVYEFSFPLGKGQAGEMIKRMKEIFARDFNPMLDKSDYEKVLYVHDYLVSRVTYDAVDPDSFRIVGPFLKGHGACQGISLLALFMLEYLNVHAFFVAGKARGSHVFDGERHAWNAVCIDGKWAYLDITNDLDGLKAYFLVDEKTLRKTHTFYAPMEGNGLFAKTLDFSSTDLEYHMRNGLAFANVEDAGKAVSDALNQGKPGEVRLLVSDERDHSQEIMDHVFLRKSASIRYYYRVETQTYRFVLA